MPMMLPRRLFEYARQTARNRRAAQRVPDTDWREVCTKADIPLDKIVQHSNASLSLELAKTTLTLPKTPAGLSILASYLFLDEMDRYTSCGVAWDSRRDGLVVTFGGAEYFAECYEEVFILSELFLAGDYDFMMSGDGVVIDVGANVGFTSIFLANLLPGLIVEGYEPLKLNFEKALRNVAANPQIAGRVTLFNYGLFSEDGTLAITSALGHRGMSSVVFDRRETARTQVEVEPVPLKRASDVVGAVRARYPDRKIAIKMDCEGSEYAIFGDLVQSGALEMIDFVVMEWHRLEDQPMAVESLRDIFLANGFHTYFRGRFQTRISVGMAIAFRAPR